MKEIARRAKIGKESLKKEGGLNPTMPRDKAEAPNTHTVGRLRPSRRSYSGVVCPQTEGIGQLARNCAKSEGKCEESRQAKTRLPGRLKERDTAGNGRSKPSAVSRGSHT